MVTSTESRRARLPNAPESFDEDAKRKWNDMIRTIQSETFAGPPGTDGTPGTPGTPGDTWAVNDAWANTPDGQRRLFFVTNGTSRYRSNGAHEFLNGSDTVVLSTSALGALNASLSVAAPTITASGVLSGNSIASVTSVSGATISAVTSVSAPAITGTVSVSAPTVTGTTTVASNGTITAGSTITAVGDITGFSDIRLKEDIEVIENPLEILSKINGVTFTKDGRRGTGVIAQEVLEVLPEAVHENDNGYLSVAYGNMVGLLVEAVKRLEERVKELEGVNSGTPG